MSRNCVSRTLGSNSTLWLLVLMFAVLPCIASGQATLVSITVSPSYPTLPVGVSEQMHAIGTYSDSSTQDITTTVTWTSSSTTVGSISNSTGSQGLATAIGAGVTYLTATQGSVSGYTSLKVKVLSSLSISPVGKTLPVSSNTQYYAVGTYSDGTTQYLENVVTWSSSATTIATVSNSAGSQGIVTCVGLGTAVITAQAGSITGNTNVIVKTLTALNVFTPSGWMPVGGTESLVVGAEYSDGTYQAATDSVQWTSSNTSVLSVGNTPATDGIITGLAAGSATATATVGSISGSVLILVKQPVSIVVTPANGVRGVGMQQQFVATVAYSDGNHQNIASFVTWGSDTPAVATVGGQGMVKAVSAGVANISAQINGVTGSTPLTVKTFSSIVVTPSTATLAASGQQSFVATANYTDSTQQNLTSLVTWSTSSPQIASVSNGLANQGIATALTTGTTTVTATAGSTSGSATVNVTSTGLGNIQHIIFFVQENRALDTYFGQLGVYASTVKNYSGYTFNGLPLNASLPGILGGDVSPYHYQTACSENLNASWDAQHLDVDGGKMDQFLVNATPSTIDTDGTRPIGYYDWTDLPYYYELAFQFATSDSFFSSVLGPTIPNRQYLTAATSSGNVQDAITVPPARLSNPTIFDLLDNAGISWRLYYQDPTEIFLKSYSTWTRDSSKAVPIANWFTDLANASTLPQVIFIERSAGTDEHPGGNVQVGANTGAGIINALMASPAWSSSVFIQAYDEGGGNYDHVVPQTVAAPDSKAPTLESTDQPGTFTTTGCRLPMLVVSPWVIPHFVSHTTREFTSILKLIETRFNLPFLTLRDANADNMTEFFDFSSPQLLTPPSLPAQPTTETCSYSLEVAPSQ